MQRNSFILTTDFTCLYPETSPKNELIRWCNLSFLTTNPEQLFGRTAQKLKTNEFSQYFSYFKKKLTNSLI